VLLATLRPQGRSASIRSGLVGGSFGGNRSNPRDQILRVAIEPADRYSRTGYMGLPHALVTRISD
jgi:hypothetical protein